MKIYHYFAVAVLIAIWPLYLLVHKLTSRSHPSAWIIGGQNATDGEFPFIAALKHFEDEYDEFCGASILASKWLLTAKHCFENHPIEEYKEKYYFLVGTNNFLVGGSIHNISRIIFHPNKYDIAIVELKNQVEFNNRTRPIVLADNRAPDNSTATAIGWGIFNKDGLHPIILQKVDLHTISIDKCCNLDNPSECDEDYLYYQTTVCTLEPAGKDTCRGDSGGPLIYNNTQIGFVLTGSMMCATGEPAIYGSVPYFKAWIHSVTGVN